MATPSLSYSESQRPLTETQKTRPRRRKGNQGPRGLKCIQYPGAHVEEAG